MSKKQFCCECYEEFISSNKGEKLCYFCIEEHDSKKHTISDKIKTAKQKDVEEWVEVKSPYKKYKEGTEHVSR